MPPIFGQGLLSKENQTDPDARLYRKSHNTASILCYQGHALMENRHGLVVGAVVTHADGTGERAAALTMLDTVPGSHAKTVGADKAYDTADFVAACRSRNVTPHVAQNEGRRGGSAIDTRTVRHVGYRLSQTIRKRIEEHFGWGKTVGRIRQTVFRGLQRVDQQFKLTMTASKPQANGPNSVRAAAGSRAMRHQNDGDASPCSGARCEMSRIQSRFACDGRDTVLGFRENGRISTAC